MTAFSRIRHLARPSRISRIGAFVLVAGVSVMGALADLAVAQDEPPAAKSGFSTTLLLDNDKVRVFEAAWKPGSASGSSKRPARVVRVTLGGTLSYVYADGRVEKVTKQTGEVYFVAADPVEFLVRNDSDTEVVLMNIFLK